MENKNNVRRNEFRHIEACINYSIVGRNTKSDFLTTAALELSVETKFSDIQRFLGDLKDILNVHKACASNGTYCHVYLSDSIYEQDNETVHSKSFDAWKFDGIPSLDDEGLYLSPDTKYTEETRDMYISYDLPLLDQLDSIGI